MTDTYAKMRDANLPNLPTDIHSAKMQMCLPSLAIHSIAAIWVLLIAGQVSGICYYVFRSNSPSTNGRIWKWILRFVEQIMHGYFIFTALIFVDERKLVFDQIEVDSGSLLDPGSRSTENIMSSNEMNESDPLSDQNPQNPKAPLPNRLKIPIYVLIYLLFTDAYLFTFIIKEGPARAFIRDSTGVFWGVKMMVEYFFIDRIMRRTDNFAVLFLLLSLINCALVINNFPIADDTRKDTKIIVKKDESIVIDQYYNYYQDIRVVKLHLIASTLPLIFGRIIQTIGGGQCDIIIKKEVFRREELSCYSASDKHAHGTFDTYMWIFGLVHVGFYVLASLGYISKSFDEDDRVPDSY